ncbi:hypothetical protein [Methylobacterium isbiliense]|jgi:hypothetical protein|uniref:Tetratricopeptide repeat protein n=1 Tax=Methylobacterium isbiliense TaxID=315478 RepID=A0ABQ4SHE6_9HYPH|nr:hypothetical protein [Methylobacterium isbiliense]MDN3624777.1 hypothetical protein [Methylobacterium isbiliense]GJE02651.1 hypothetical protein GMJLKIPL_4600 [Methylobacterium isbiliense]
MSLPQTARTGPNAAAQMAEAAHRDALAPAESLAGSERAALQHQLGIALTGLGERESGAERLEEAVAAYRAAQEELTADRAPAYAEVVQRNIDHASRLLRARTDPAVGEP